MSLEELGKMVMVALCFSSGYCWKEGKARELEPDALSWWLKSVYRRLKKGLKLTAHEGSAPYWADTKAAAATTARIVDFIVIVCVE